MAFKLPRPNFKKLTEGGPKLRVFIALIIIIVVLLVFSLLSKLFGGDDTNNGTQIASAPNVRSVTDSKDVSPQYVKAVLKSNQQAAERAQVTGGSALPTILNTGEDSGGDGANGACGNCCGACEGQGVDALLNQFAQNNQISPMVQNTLANLAKRNVPVSEYAARLQQLVREGKLTPDQARQLLAAYRKQYQDKAIAPGKHLIDDMIRSGQLPLDAANGLLDLQKRNVPVADYAAHLQRLVREGKISPATAARLLAQYRKQHADQLRRATASQLAQLEQEGKVPHDAAKMLGALQNADVPVQDYQNALQRLVREGKITPATAARLLQQYKKEKGDLGDAGVQDMSQKAKLPADAAAELNALKKQDVSPEQYANELQRLVKEGKISPQTAAALLKGYKQLHAARAASEGQINDLVHQGLLPKAAADRLLALQHKNVPVSEYEDELNKLVKSGQISPQTAARLLAQYKKLHGVASANDNMMNTLQHEKELPADAANDLLNLQRQHVPESVYAQELQRLVAQGKISPEVAEKLLTAYRQKLRKEQLAKSVNQLSGPIADMNLPNNVTFGAPAAQQQAYAAQQYAAAAQTAVDQREVDAAKARYAQQVQTQAQTMANTAQQLVNVSWKPVPQTYVAGQNKPEDYTAASAHGGSGLQQASSSAGDIPIIKAGAVLYGVLETAVNSDYPQSPVMVTIVSGKYKGAKLIGKIQTVNNGQRVLLQFNLMSMKNWVTTASISAYAIDPNTARSPLATSVNNHYLLRYGTLFASAFLQGFSEAVQESGSAYVNLPTATGSTVVAEQKPQLNTQEKVAIALGQVGQQASTEVGRLVQTPPTVHVKSGVGVGILFTQDVTAPK